MRSALPADSDEGSAFSQSSRMQVRFWGVRGSIPVAQADCLAYGGNTACIEVRLPENQILIIDAGTGIHNLGHSLRSEFQDRKLALQLFLTHFHWDHIQGLPYFAPLYDAGNEVVFHSGHLPSETREILDHQMSSPYFPVRLEMLAATRSFVQASSNAPPYPKLAFHPFPLNHSGGATGCRLELEGAVVVHASDVEHGHPRLDSILRDHAQNADLLIYDAQYTPEEYEHRCGWGHSTWLEAARVAMDAHVKKLILFHHDPAHVDSTIDQMLANTRCCFENTDAAREGLTITL